MRTLRFHPIGSWLLALLIVGCSDGSVGGATGGAGGGSGGTGGGGGGTGGTGGGTGQARSWCDPATWRGTVPTATTDVTIPSGAVVTVDCDAEAHRVEIPAGTTLQASRSHGSRLTVHGNLVVRGLLDYGTPSDRIGASVTAEIIFQGMRDGDYVGTPGPPGDVPIAVLESDVGLWVVDSGRFTAAGQLKRAWSKLTVAAEPGDPTFSVEDATGWRPGDRVVLTPTAPVDVADHYEQFDEGTLATVSGNDVTLSSAPPHPHLGCPGCMPRAEAANLSRNVVVRSYDDTAHAHMLIANQGLLQLDSVELRWLGPETCGGPARRAPIYFHQQRWDADASFVRHVSIWGGQKSFLVLEVTSGVEVNDVAGYDASDFGFVFMNGCAGPSCTNTGNPEGTIFTDVLAAKLNPATRADGCLRIGNRHAGFIVNGGEGTGCLRCVATGVTGIGDPSDSGFGWAEGNPCHITDFTFNDNVAHNNNASGAFVWKNNCFLQPPYQNNEFWSNSQYGIEWGAYDNSFAFQNLTAIGNGRQSFGAKAVPDTDRVRLDGALIDDFVVLSYVVPPNAVAYFRNVTFTGNRSVGITQLHNPCVGGNQNDPNDSSCMRIWLRFENLVFPSGVVPFDFGLTENRTSVWEIRGFSHPDYPGLPANFDLYRADNQVPGGSCNATFDAWLVPR